MASNIIAYFGAVIRLSQSHNSLLCVIRYKKGGWGNSPPVPFKQLPGNTRIQIVPAAPPFSIVVFNC